MGHSAFVDKALSALQPSWPNNCYNDGLSSAPANVARGGTLALIYSSLCLGHLCPSNICRLHQAFLICSGSKPPPCQRIRQPMRPWWYHLCEGTIDVQTLEDLGFRCGVSNCLSHLFGVFNYHFGWICGFITCSPDWNHGPTTGWGASCHSSFSLFAAGDQDLFKFVIDYHRDRNWDELRAKALKFSWKVHICH